MTKRIQKIVLFTLAVYSLFGFIILPLVLKSQIVDIVQKETNAKISIDSVYFNPFAFKLKISGIKLDTSDDIHLLSSESVELNVELYSLLNYVIHVKNFILEKPEISLIKSSDKSLNFSKIVKAGNTDNDQEKEYKDDNSTSTELPRIIIDKIAVVDGSVNYEDYTKKDKFDFSFNDIRFMLKNIDTNDFNASDATLRFYSLIGESGFVDLKSKITGFKPFSVEGSLSFEVGKFYTQLKYLQENLQLEVANGKLSFYTDYSLNLDDLNAASIDNLTLSLNKLRVKPKGSAKDILNLETFYIKDVTIKPMMQSIHLSKIGLESLYVKVQRDKNAQLDWLEYIKSESDEDKKSVKKPELKESNNTASTKWNIAVEDISLQKINLDFYDETAENVHTIYDLNMGSIKVAFDLNVTIKGSNSFVDLSHTNVNLGEFSFNNKSTNESIISFSEFDIYGLNLNTKKKNILIEKSILNSLNIQAVIHKDGSMNIDSLTASKESKDVDEQVKVTKEEKAQQDETEQKDSGYTLLLKHFALKSAKIGFSDSSLAVKYQTDLHDLNADMYDISNIPFKNTSVNLSGIIDKYGSMKLKGALNIANPGVYTDVYFSFKNLELNSFSGYSANFTGHKLDKGKIYVDLGYKILDSELLGKNSFIIKNAELGDSVDDDNITKLPIGFVFALLEDKDGVIELNMPVKGNLDDPDFKYGTLVLKTFTNLIEKAVTSPFRFIGSMMGIDGAALEYAEFEAGSTEILPPEREKLDKIATMLINRPKISLSVEGKYDTTIDKRAIQNHKLAVEIIQRSGLKDGADYKSKITVELLEQIYKESKDDKRLQRIKDELSKKYKDETLEIAYLNALTDECITIQPLADEELTLLAEKRSQMIKSYLLDVKKIDKKRIKLLKAALSNEENEKFVKSKLKLKLHIRE